MCSTFDSSGPLGSGAVGPPAGPLLQAAFSAVKLLENHSGTPSAASWEPLSRL